MRLVIRQIDRLTIDRGRGGKDDARTPRRLHRPQQGQSAGDVHVIVFDRLPLAFTHRLETCEMHYRFGGKGAGNGAEPIGIANIGLMGLKRAVRQGLNTGQRLRRSVGIAVHNADLMPLTHQFDQGVAADIASATCYQNPHEPSCH